MTRRLTKVAVAAATATRMVKHEGPSIPVSKLSSIAMTTGGEKAVTKVIHGGLVKEWVGIGWIGLREPTNADRRTIPQAVDSEGRAL